MSISIGTALVLSVALQASHPVPPGADLVRLAEADLSAIVPGLTGSTNATAAPQESVHAVQPSYQRWDVLRQYPRYTPTTQPSVPAAKPQETPKDAKDHHDA